MKKDQLSFLDTTCLIGYSSLDHRCYFEDPSFLENLASALPINFYQPAIAEPSASSRQQVLERILDKVAEQDFVGQRYVEQYLRHKYRRNCKSNTLKQAATSLMQFLSFFGKTGKEQLEQLNREDIEAFV
jgi:hypothetical protein